jgi:hypothetical protein
MIAVLGGLADVERDLIRPHRRGPQPGAEARAAHRPTAEAHRRAEGKGPVATGARRDGHRTRASHGVGKSTISRL